MSMWNCGGIKAAAIPILVLMFNTLMMKYD